MHASVLFFLLFLSIALHINCVVSLFSSIDCIYSYIKLLAASLFNKFSVSVKVKGKGQHLL